MRYRQAWGLFVVLVLVGCTPSQPPDTPKAAVTDAYHGVEVMDDYRWLEDWNDPRVRDWSAAQNSHARRVLDALPHVSEIRARISAILQADSPSYTSLARREGVVFAIKHQPPREQPFLVAMASTDQPETSRIVLDPNEIDPEGSTTIDWYVPSPDGGLLAASLSKGGSESGNLHIIDAATGQPVDEVIPRVNGGTAGGDVVWTNDGTGLYYTRYPRPGERPDEELDLYQQVWFHRLGSPAAEDRYEFGQDLARVAEIRLQIDRRSGRILATVQYGDSGRFQHVLRETDGSWRPLTTYDDEVVEATFAPDGSLILVSRKGAPRGKILKTGRSDLALDSASVIVEETAEAIVSDFYGSPPIVVTPRRLFVTYQLGGPSTVRCFDHSGRPRPGPDFPPVSSVGQIVALEGDAILVRSQSYLQPPAWYRFTRRDSRTERTALFERSPVDLSGVTVSRESATSRDGTQVPVTVLGLEDARRGAENFGLLTGYGGFGISIEPRFDPLKALWLEQGGIWAVANLRGGGEFGERWHRAGSLTEKQNVFDDFAAAMRYLIDGGHVTSESLAIRGGSNGGLLMGAMITQHPDLARTVVSLVGIYDMLRFELSPNGRFNIPEYGTVEDPDQFRALHAYSPYHNVEDGTRYPSILFLTGANDPRVDPMQSRKMTARLQAANATDRPILLRTSGETGHGGGTPLSARIDELTDVYAFLFAQLGVDYRVPGTEENDVP